jgi:hypothetical protein
MLSPINPPWGDQMPKPVIPWKGKRRLCGALTCRGTRCQRWPVHGKTRCHRHGGRSTGPRTPEGKASSLAGRMAGFQRWCEAHRAEIAAGLATGWPGGRKPGGPWTIKAHARKMEAEQQVLSAAEARLSAPPVYWPRGRPTEVEQAERLFIATVNQWEPDPAMVEYLYGKIVEAEPVIGRPAGREQRLARVQYEYDRYRGVIPPPSSPVLNDLLRRMKEAQAENTENLPPLLERAPTAQHGPPLDAGACFTTGAPRIATGG